jgi:hypothetical protein
MAVAGYLTGCLVKPFIFFHVPNGGRKSFNQGTRLKKMGVKAGIPDIVILGDSRAFLIELKREVGGRLSDAQKLLHPEIIAAGCPVATCRSLEEVKAALETWGVPLRAHKLDFVAQAMRNAFAGIDVVTEQPPR